MQDTKHKVPEEVIQKAEAIKKKLLEASHAYYVENKSIMQDEVYDSLLETLANLEKQYKLDTTDSPTQKVMGGFSKDLKKVKHRYPMLSLKKATTNNDLHKKADGDILAWNAVIDRLLGNRFANFTVELKYDGLALSLIYSKGELVEALTRGDGLEGESVLENALNVRGIPRVISNRADYFEVRGEVVMPKSRLDDISSNTRNVAAGAMRGLDPRMVKERCLTFFPYQVLPYDEWKSDSHHETLLSLKEEGFVIPTYNFESAIIQDLIFFQEYTDFHSLFEAYELVKEIRDNLDFDIDGVVYKLDSRQDQERVGSTDRAPRWAIAHKFLAKEAQTTLLAIDTQVGRTGKLTPVARFEPVNLGGVQISSASLHNASNIHSKLIRVGDKVTVRRAGDVIPEIADLVEAKDPRGEPYTVPSQCPACGSPTATLEGAVDTYCTGGLKCPEQLKGSLEHFASVPALNIQGLGSKTIQTLVDNKVVNHPSKVFELTEEDLLAIGIGEGRAKKLLNELRKARKAPLSKFIYALGIPLVGLSASFKLATHCTDLKSIASVYKEIGLSPSVVSSLENWLSIPSNLEVLVYLDGFRSS